MKKLLIDAGNSSLKWAFWDNQQLSKMQSIAYGEKSPLRSFENILENLNLSNIEIIVMVSVLGSKFNDSVKTFCTHSSIKFTHIESDKQLAGVTVAYDEPYKLGTDRLVAMVAAHKLAKGQACIVVDTGTATTIDAIDSHGQHLGGVILSGLDLCRHSLLNNTELLASYNESKASIKPQLFSKNTKQAIASGSLYGLAGAIETICSQMEKEIQNMSIGSRKVDDKDIKKIICGGSAEVLIPHLRAGFSYKEDLIMQGLKIIEITKQLK